MTRRAARPAIPSQPENAKIPATAVIPYGAPNTNNPRGTATMPAVTVEDRGAISIIRINRPERLNAINQDVAVELQRASRRSTPTTASASRC